MSQVPVQWVYETFDEKPPEIKAGKKYVLRATGDMDIVPHAVVPLSALRVELQEIMPFCTKGQGNAYLSIAEIRERLERLLASLGEQ